MGLKKNPLGSSGMMVTEAGLGTMTFGLQVKEADAHAILDYAVKERGINLIDTAEMYPVPTAVPEWKPGVTEEIIGTWLEKNHCLRPDIVIASKVSGFQPKSPIVANRHPEKYAGKPKEEFPDSRLTAESVIESCEASLRRLKTDYLDLLQVHWPDRYVNLFGARNWEMSRERDAIPIEETLKGFKSLLDSGKIRHYGLSNETTYGVAEWVHAADKLGMPRPVSIQNQFCLVYREFEGQLAEACSPTHYNLGLLPWSILGGGVLTGKYLGKIDVAGKKVDETVSSCRFGRFPNYQSRFLTNATTAAVEKYQAIADEAGMSLATLAQAFCKSRWYIPCSLIGATSLDHVRENIDAFGVELSPEILTKIDLVHTQHTDPITFIS